MQARCNSRPSRAWILTTNNPHALLNRIPGRAFNQQQATIAKGLFQDVFDKLKPRYMAGQFEKGEETGVVHLQWVVYLDDKVAFTTFKDTIGLLFPRDLEHVGNFAGSHIEKCRSTDRCFKYVEKSHTAIINGGPYYLGDKPAQGKRSDLEAVSDMVIEGQTIERIATQYPTQFIRYHQGISQLQGALRTHPRKVRTRGICFYGPTGSGKSLRAVSFAEELAKNPADVYYKNNTKWWDGYTGQTVVVWDEFDPSVTSRKTLLGLLDHAPRLIEPKGGMINMCAKYIIFTHIEKPNHWYPESHIGIIEDHELNRRFKTMRNFADHPCEFQGSDEESDFELSGEDEEYRQHRPCHTPEAKSPPPSPRSPPRALRAPIPSLHRHDAMVGLLDDMCRIHIPETPEPVGPILLREHTWSGGFDSDDTDEDEVERENCRRRLGTRFNKCRFIDDEARE